MPFLSSASKATKISLGIVAGLVLLIGVVPYVITWNQYKSVITDKVAAQLGREMEINGNVRFSILPRPEAHVSDIVIKNPAGSTTKNFLQLDQLDVAVALFPLLRKNIEIEKITLVKPAITLEKMANGANNWTFTPTKTEKTEDAKPDTAAEQATSLKINDIDLQDAFIRYVDTPGKSVQTIGPINAKLNLESLQGPYGAKGDITYNKAPITFDVVVGAKDAETKIMPVTADLNIGGKDMTARFKGNITQGDALSVSGDITAQSNDVASVLNAIAPASGKDAAKDAKKTELPKGLNSFDLKSQLLYSANKIALPGLQIKGDGLDILADTIITTGARTNVSLDISRLSVPPSLVGGDDAGSADNKKSDHTPLVEVMQNGFNSAQKILDIAMPTAPLDIIVSADAISLPGKPSIRDMRLAASSDQNQFTLQSLQAKLAGNTHIAVTAKAPLGADKKPTQLTTTLVMSSDNPALAFSADATTNAAGKNDPISINATATLNRKSLLLQPVQITQQGQTLNGAIVYEPKAAMPLAVSLRGGALNLDSFKSADAAKSAAASGDTAKTDSSSSILNRLKGFKAQFDVAIDKVITGGKNLRHVTAKGTFSEAGLNLQQAQANLEGLALGTAGTIGKLSPVGDLNLTVQGNTANLSQTLQALGNAEARNLGTTSFNGTVKGDLAKMALNLDAKLDQGAGKINGNVLGLDDGKPGFDGTIALNHPETATIVRNFAKMSPTSNLGAFALNAKINYAGDTIKADNFAVKLGSAGGVTGSVDVTPKGTQKDINATIKADKLNLAALMGDDTPNAAAKGSASGPAAHGNDGWSRDPINLETLRNLNGKVTVKVGELLYKDFVIRNFNNDLAFANGTMKLNDLSADLFEAGRFVVNGTLDAGAAGQAHKGQFNINFKDTDAAKFFNALDSKLFQSGTFSGQQQLNFNGASPYQIINSLNGDGQLNIRKAVANGIDLDALAAKLDRPNSVSDFMAIADQAQAGGTTDIGDVDVPISIRNGIATITQTTVKTKLTATNFGGTADLPAKLVNMSGQITFTEQKNMPPLSLRITGPFSAPRKELDKNTLQQFALQKGLGKYQDKITNKIDKLIGDKIPGGSGGALGGALGNLLGVKPKAAVPVVTPAAETPTPRAAPVSAPAVVEPVAAPAAVEPAPAAATPEPAAAATPTPDAAPAATDAAPAQ